MAAIIRPCKDCVVRGMASVNPEAIHRVLRRSIFVGLSLGGLGMWPSTSFGQEVEECLDGKSPACIKRCEEEIKSHRWEEARGFCELACRAGNRLGCVAVGQLKEKQGQLKEAMDLYTAECKYKQNNEACHHLGFLLLPQNPREARSWFELACSRQFGPSCGNLGVLEREQGHHDQAKRFYKQACDQGNSYACQRIRENF